MAMRFFFDKCLYDFVIKLMVQIEVEIQLIGLAQVREEESQTN
jgi:hypothetical protein